MLAKLEQEPVAAAQSRQRGNRWLARAAGPSVAGLRRFELLLWVFAGATAVVGLCFIALALK